MEEELTNEQTKRQDLVDNAIYTMLNEVNPSNKEIDWNIEIISHIRELVQSYFVNELSVVDEMTFYPYLKEK